MPDNNDTTTLVWTKPDGSTQTGPKDEIMAAYWQAGKVGTLAAPAVVPAAPVVSADFGNLVVDEAKGAKIREREEKIKAAGFALPDPWFAAGTRMIQAGVDKYRATYEEWAERPLAEESMRAVAQRIREERRTDFTVRLGDLHMDADGCLGRKGRPASPIEWSAWKRIYSMLQGEGVLPDGVRLLAALDPATRALVVNERLAALDPDKEVQIGLRRNAATGGWSIFRAVSTRYPTDGQADVILDGMADRIDGLDWRGSVVYDTGSTSVRFDAAHMVSPEVLDPAVGDVFRGGVKGGTNDAGGGRFTIDPFVGRIICINCTIADAYAPGYSRIHRGSMEAALDAASTVVGKAASVLPIFAADWTVLRDTTVTAMPWERVVGRKSAEEVEDVPTALRALVHAGRVDHGTARDALVEHLLASYAAEPGNGTVADVLNAVTRAAHEGLVDAIQRDVLERQAGKLVPLLARVATGTAAEAR